MLRAGDAPEPEGEVVVHVKAAGINFFDLLQVRGGYQYKPPFPFIPGAEVAGIRADTGQRVMAFCGQGGYAETAVARGDRVFPVPGALDDAEAAAFLIAYHTAWFVLNERCRLQAGEWLLVHAGASGTGMAAIQVGRALGANVIATASSEAKLDFCLQQGAQHAISYADPAWVMKVRELTAGAGANVIFDPVGGDAFDLSLKCTAMEARLAVVGFASGRIPTVAANRLLLRNISIVGAVWGAYAEAHPEYVAKAHDHLTALLADGKLRPSVKHRYPFEDAPQALRDVDSRKILGKAVLVL